MTKHLVPGPAPVRSVSIVPQSLGGGYGTGVSISGALGVGGLPGIVSTNLKLYQVSYDACNQNVAKIVVGTTSQTLPVVTVRTATGISSAKLSTDQPYIQSYQMSQNYITVFDVPIKFKDKYMNVLVAQSDGSSYILSNVDVKSCVKTVKFAEIPVVSGQVNPRTPSLHDLETQIDNGTKMASEKAVDQYVTNQSLTISGTVTSASPLDRAELRFVQMGGNVTQYTAVKMNVTATNETQTYNVTATIPWDRLISPAIQYWLWIENQDQLTRHSENYTIGVTPSYAMNTTMGLEMPKVIVEGTSFSPTIYLQNNANGTAYGTISLMLYNVTTATFAGNVYGPGMHVATLEWDSGVHGHLMSYPVQVKSDFYGKSFVTNETMLYTVPSTLSLPLSNMSEIKSFVDENGTTLASAHTLYSSFRSVDDTIYSVIFPDGTCMIGDSNNCLIQNSTLDQTNHTKTITLNGQEFTVQYSGSDNPLQRFTITSSEPIVGHWKILLEKNGQEQIQSENRTLLKIKYVPDDSLLVSTLK